MKTLFILLALFTTNMMASSLFSAEELTQIESHNFTMPQEKEVRVSRTTRKNPMKHQFRTGRVARTECLAIVNRTTRLSRFKQHKVTTFKLAKLF